MQQDQDPKNAEAILTFALNRLPSGSQLILGTVGLHDVPYEGHVIKTEHKLRLLASERYAEVSDHLGPYYNQLLS